MGVARRPGYLHRRDEQRLAIDGIHAHFLYLRPEDILMAAGLTRMSDTHRGHSPCAGALAVRAQ